MCVPTGADSFIRLWLEKSVLPLAYGFLWLYWINIEMSRKGAVNVLKTFCIQENSTLRNITQVCKFEGFFGRLLTCEMNMRWGSCTVRSPWRSRSVPAGAWESAKAGYIRRGCRRSDGVTVAVHRQKIVVWHRDQSKVRCSLLLQCLCRCV